MNHFQYAELLGPGGLDEEMALIQHWMDVIEKVVPYAHRAQFEYWWLDSPLESIPQGLSDEEYIAKKYFYWLREVPV
jgi:hypothetical protein